MRKTKKRTMAVRMSEAADIADDVILEDWDDNRITVLAEQFLELRQEYVRLHTRHYFGIEK